MTCLKKFTVSVAFLSVNSSSPLISQTSRGFGAIWAKSEIAGKLWGSQWNSVGFCMVLNMNSVGIPGGFRGNAGFSGNLFRVIGAPKGFCANSHTEVPAKVSTHAGGVHLSCFHLLCSSINKIRPSGPTCPAQNLPVVMSAKVLSGCTPRGSYHPGRNYYKINP